MQNLLNTYLAIPKIKCDCLDFELGQKVRFLPEIESALIEYYNKNKDRNGYINLKWLRLGEILSEPKNPKWFNLLHIAKDENSAYPLGTAIIEISYNEDLEIRADALTPVLIQNQTSILLN